MGTELEVCIGHEPGRSLRLVYLGKLEDEQRLEGHVITGRVSTWQRVAVQTGLTRDDGDKSYRLFVLVPGAEPNEIKHGPFYVRGRFHVLETINNSRAAREEADAFEPS